MPSPLVEATRTLTVVLRESDWRALRAAEPDAIGWLHARIQERLAPERVGQSSAPRSSSDLTQFDD